MEKKKIELIAASALVGLFGIVLVYNLRGVAKPTGPAQEGEIRGNYEEQLMQVEMMVNRLPQQRAVLAELEERTAAASREIPAESDHTWLSRQISRMAAEAGVSDVSLRFHASLPPGPAADKELEKRYGEKRWEVSLRCGYHELGRFLAALEGSNPYLSVTDLRIEGNEPNGQKVSLSVSYLVRKGEGNGGGGEGKVP